MRLDKYLKVSRLIKRRTVANEACDSGRVQINGKIAKASTDVKIGDIIEFTNTDTNEIIRVEVINLYKKANFFDLFKDFDYKRFGLDTGDASIMYDFYSKEEINKYGVIGIEIKLI